MEGAAVRSLTIVSTVKSLPPDPSFIRMADGLMTGGCSEPGFEWMGMSTIVTRSRFRATSTVAILAKRLASGLSHRLPRSTWSKTTKYLVAIFSDGGDANLQGGPIFKSRLITIGRTAVRYTT